MIRINLLHGMAATPTAKPIIGRRELGLAVVLLAAGGGALLYLGSASRPPLPSAAPSEPVTPTATPVERQPPVPEPEPLPPTFRLDAVSIRAEADATLILIQVDPRVTHHESQLTGPDRLVIDIANCQVAIPAGQYQAVDHPQVRRVRTSQFQTDPPVARVVVDLKSAPRYQLRAGRQGLEVRVANP